MPIYEFHCEQCARDSEILVRSSDWKGTECPHCGSKKLSKKFSVFASAGSAGSEGRTTGARDGCDDIGMRLFILSAIISPGDRLATRRRP